jgi:hypothetical protein
MTVSLKRGRPGREIQRGRKLIEAIDTPLTEWFYGQHRASRLTYTAWLRSH